MDTIANERELVRALAAYAHRPDQAAFKAAVIQGALRLDQAGRLPRDWQVGMGKDHAHQEFGGPVDWSNCWIPCPECPDRRFLSADGLAEHAEKVHTFSDIEQVVGDAIREKYGRRGDYEAVPPVSSIWTWIENIADDWVVFRIDGGDKDGLWQASYVLDENDDVTLGEPFEVVRRTVYDPVKES